MADQMLTPITYGAVRAANRLVMAPLTRLRAGDDGVVGDVVVEYYRQRASVGLIITEGTWPVREGRSWIGQPGIETDEQVEAWAKVADAVHAEGGKIVMQVMHGGRVSHPEFTGTGRVVSASATASPEPARLPSGKVESPTAHALSEEEIEDVITGFVAGCRNAIAAGIDAVELHGANGYLIHQFLAPSSNCRDDDWGGDPERRARLAIDVIFAVAEAIGADRTGIRLSPQHNIQGVLELDDDATATTYRTWANAVAPLRLAFVDLLRQDPADRIVQDLRRIVNAPMILNTGFATMTTREEATAILEMNLADAVAVGRPLIATPDLLRRWAEDLPENTPDGETFYRGGERGYIDYPTVD